MREWFAHYPFAYLEQKTSKAIGLRDTAMWQTVVAQLPTYLDADGLASYFPPRDGDAPSGSDMTWVVLSDPISGGASILGSGLGRDAQIATAGEKRSGKGWPVFEERSFEAFRSYYDHLGAGNFKTEYTLRLNNAGSFALPSTRIEAMYAPEVFGELPNARVTVEPGK